MYRSRLTQRAQFKFHLTSGRAEHYCEAHVATSCFTLVSERLCHISLVQHLILELIKYMVYHLNVYTLKVSMKNGHFRIWGVFSYLHLAQARLLVSCASCNLTLNVLVKVRDTKLSLWLHICLTTLVVHHYRPTIYHMNTWQVFVWIA